MTVASLFGDLAFSVSTYHDSILAAGLCGYFIYYIISEIKVDRESIKQCAKSIFTSAKWLYIAIILYLAFDIVTMLYTKDIYYSLKKLPYLVQYAAVFYVVLFALNNKKRITAYVGTILSTGLIVAIGSYIYYFFTKQPIYFMRLSTTRDYNVFACVLLFAAVLCFDFFLNVTKLSTVKRVLFFTLCAIVISPSFYLAGSRRMAIMMPFFLITAVIFIVAVFITVESERKTQIFAMLLVAIITAVYLLSTMLLDPFTKYGTSKENDYKQYLEDIKNNPEKAPDKEEEKEPYYSETSIGEMLETIEDKSMMSKRKLIYKVAFDEIATFTPMELIFGKGASYDMYMYYTTDDAELLKAYSIGENNVRDKTWLSVHNFMLSDVLSGGIIKFILGLFVVVQLIWHIIKCVKINKSRGLVLIICVGTVLTTNFISGAFGMLNDIFFYITLTLMVATLKTNKLES